YAGDQLELRLAEVGRDVRMCKCGAECDRMRRFSQSSLAIGAQALLLDAVPQGTQRLRRQRTQPLDQTRHCGRSGMLVRAGWRTAVGGIGWHGTRAIPS